MPVRKRRFVQLFILFAVLTATTILFSVAAARQPTKKTGGKNYRLLLPLVFSPSIPAQVSALDLINQLRANAGVPAIGYNPVLERNCFEHARYMAENNELTHNQNLNRPYASSRGQTCARQANVWLGSEQPPNPWRSGDAVRGWMASVPHRAWLLYPTTEVFGFGFYTGETSKRSAAALDVLSGADFAADEAFGGWPVRYPGKAEKDIPASRFPITLNWRYFGPEPVVKSVSLTTGDGTIIPHEATTQMSSGHKGIQIISKADLPKQSKIIVSVAGQYDGRPFSYSWYFFTNSTPQTSGKPQTGRARKVLTGE